MPESYDSQPPTLDLGMVNLFDAQLSVETTEVEDALAGVPAARIAARSKAGQQVYAVIYKRGDPRREPRQQPVSHSRPGGAPGQTARRRQHRLLEGCGGAAGNPPGQG